MGETREERIERILALVSPDASGERKTRAIAYIAKVLDAIELIDGAKKRRRAILTKDELRDFSRWYSVYPRHEARGQAEISFKRALLLTDIETLLTGATRYAKHVAGKEREFTRLAATWLNGKGWLDEYSSPQSPTLSTAQSRRADLVELARKGITTSAMTPDILAEARGNLSIQPKAVG